MNVFNDQIQKAANRQRIFILSLVAIFLTLSLSLGAFAFLLKGTPLQIQPLEISKTAHIEASGGFSGIFEGTLFSFSRSPTVTVSAEGFKTKTRTVAPAVEGQTLVLTLEELPARLLLKTSLPEAVQWSLNGKPVAVDPSLDTEVKAGTYQVQIDHKYHQSEIWDLTVERGQLYEERIPLKPVEGSLSLSVKPEDAHLFVDDIEQTELPVTLQKPGGAYTVRIQKDTYQTIEDTVEITADRPVAVRNYQMQLLQSYLTVTPRPTGGVLTLNGKPLKKTSKIPVGAGKSYFLKYEKAGFFPFEKKIFVAPGDHRKLDISLRTEIAEISLTSTPTATILINGQPVGQSPLKIRLPAKPHQVKFVKSGYQSVTKTIRPSSKSTTRLSVTLQTEQAARLAAARKSYKNTAGMTLKLFKPGRITLGAPRHEKGQRANEFIRNVSLTRHFYIAENEVTEKQFAAFKGAARGTSPRLPAANMTWIEAAQYCNWLSKKEGFTSFYTFKGTRYAGFNPASNGYRLPSEAEWEWLARKAGRNKQSLFPWGDTAVIPPGSGNIADESANGITRFYVPNYTDGHARLAPVGSYKTDKAGLYDLFGNVSEWVHDYYSLIPPSKGETLKDPLGEQVGDKHVIKGANWSSGTLTEIRPAYRQSADKGSKTVGFRVARYL
ncbi:MAG: SUMF1/EgtB/PvdO family nonheme iron enzyme [Sneathiella sp.]